MFPYGLIGCVTFTFKSHRSTFLINKRFRVEINGTAMTAALIIQSISDFD